MAVTIDGSAGVTTNAGGSVNPSTTIDGINYSCRAWCNFNGTGTPAIRASGNVSSITDNGTGNYTVNFTTAMSDVNFAVIGTARSIDSNSYFLNLSQTTDLTTTTATILTESQTSTATDLSSIYVAIFR